MGTDVHPAQSGRNNRPTERGKDASSWNTALEPELAGSPSGQLNPPPHFQMGKQAREGKGLGELRSELGPELPVPSEGSHSHRALTLGRTKLGHSLWPLGSSQSLPCGAEQRLPLLSCLAACLLKSQAELGERTPSYSCSSVFLIFL